MTKERGRKCRSAVKEAFLAVLLLLVAALPACNCDQENAPAETIVFDGLTRQFALYAPAIYDPAVPTPTLVVLHGKDQNLDDIQFVTQFNELSERYGFLVLYPESYKDNWNDGRAVAGIPAYDQDVDDVGFVHAVLERVAITHNIDAKRLYVCGFSNGAMMAQRIAFEEPEIYAAMAAVSGTIPQNVADAGPPAAPIPVCMMHGTDDELIPWEGGVLYPSDPQGIALSVPDSVGYWITLDQCPGPPAVEQLPNRETFNTTSVRKYTYGPGLLDTYVVFYWIEDGGHAWPGTSLLQAPFVQGNISQDLDASEAIWAFCAQFSR